MNSQRSHLCIECLLFGEITGAVGTDVVEVPDTTETVAGPDATDTVEGGGTGAVGGVGLAIAAWWQAARFAGDSSPCLHTLGFVWRLGVPYTLNTLYWSRSSLNNNNIKKWSDKLDLYLIILFF